MVTQEVQLPEFSTLTVQEVNVSTATLMTAAPYLGKVCEGVNNEFMLCRMENNDPRPCVNLGKLVTKCALQLFQQIKLECPHEFKQYANCVDKSSTDYKPWPCRKTQAVFDGCMKEKLCIDRPDFGYFTRGRIHSGSCAKAPPPPPCPCESKVKDPTPGLPECKPRPPARFTSRLFWITE